MELECFEHSFGILVLIPDDLDPQMIMIYQKKNIIFDRYNF